jgi:LuxR family maltose regulon positive regulatory protein
MDQSLLLSKFHIPQTKHNLVTRPRLLDMLEEGLTKKLIVLSAPAGFGKTTLLADWLSRRSQPAAWLSLDDADNDIARFLKYVVVALQTLDPQVDNTVLNLLQSPQPILQNAALTALLNQIEDIQTDSLLVLDDYHWISNPNIHQAIDYLLSYLPSNLHLIISSRADPPLQLSLLRGRGELLELRMSDLRFDDEEVKEFLSIEVDMELSEQCISVLTARTEGWISGLQMATLSLRGKENVERFINSFSGSHKYILDYLVEEVLRQQSPELHQFLLLTSILERLCGSLCDEVVGRNDSQILLEQLEKENLFLIPLDDKREWYRYHQLFKDLLIHRLSLEHADQIPLLYHRASSWHEKCGLIPHAIDYAIEAGDIEHAALLIAREAENTLMRSEVNTYQRWISKLPADLLQENSEMVFLEAWSHILQGNDIERVFRTISEIKDIDSKLTGRVEALTAFVHVSKGEFSLAGNSARQALEKLPLGDYYFRSMAAWILGVVHAIERDMKGSLVKLEDLSTSLDLQLYPMLDVMLRSQIARIHFHVGNFHRAQDLFEQALELAQDKQGNWFPIAGEALMGLGDLYRERNKLDQATDMILEGIELTQQWRKVTAIDGYLYLARVKQLQKDWELANQALEKAMQLAVEYDAMDMDDRMVAMWQARLWSFEGQKHLVEEWFINAEINDELKDITNEDTFSVEHYLIAREKIVLARFYLMKKQYKRALSLISKLIIIFENYGRLDFLIEIYLIQSLTFHQIKQTASSIQALDKALQLGEQGGFLGLFLECDSDLIKILDPYKKRKGSSAYICSLLDGFQEDSPSPKVISPPLLLEPLSDRELDVLRHLPNNLTTPEIADEMMLSVNTVRTHIKNIYQKLDVHKRSEAVKHAKDLNLI